MCGICGELRFDGHGAVTARDLSAMLTPIVHRGPDHGATWVSPGQHAGLGFRRLSIIDLRPAGNQPIPNEDGSVQLVFNGEIYNYKDLRAGLVARGHTFRSDADSETIVHLYEELGDRAIDQLEGMFAIAIWDERAGRLLLARDRVGKKPLYYRRDASRLVFGSEIKSLLAHPDLTFVPDESAIPYYFLYGYVPHPQTFYKDVLQVEPGTVITFDRHAKQVSRRYWQLTFPPASAQKESEPIEALAARRVRDLVTAAVERRLMSDVPLGAFLSGGVDSTIVVGVMSRLMGSAVRTFSIGFEGDPAFDETDIARETAKRFGTDHTEFRVTPSAIDLLDTLVYHHDGPFGDSSAIPTYLVSKLTRQHVTVALTGDGGDEVFAGYLRFGAAVAAERVPQLAGRAANAMLGALPSPANERHLLARARRFARFMNLPLEDRLTAWSGIFYDDVEALLEPMQATGALRVDRRRNVEHLQGIADASPLSRVLAANVHSYLHDDLLVKADRMSMANSLEARAPFLDRALMEYVAGLPDHYKMSGGVTKRILRSAFADLIPENVNRAGKKGFGVPLDAWFRGALGAYVRDLLLVPGARLRSYVSQPYVSRLLDEHAAGRANHGHRLWTLLTFERWLELLPTWQTRT